MARVLITEQRGGTVSSWMNVTIKSQYKEYFCHLISHMSYLIEETNIKYENYCFMKWKWMCACLFACKLKGDHFDIWGNVSMHTVSHTYTHTHLHTHHKIILENIEISLAEKSSNNI